MHKLYPSDSGTSGPNLWTWVLLLAAGLLTGFAATAALRGNSIWFFLMFGAFICFGVVWGHLQRIPQGTLKGNPLRVIKFAFAHALHGTVIEVPEVSISDKTLRLGQEFIILYQQCFNQQVHLSRFSISLDFREELCQEANDAESDNVDTVQRYVQEFQRGPEDIPRGLFYDKKSFRIPKDATPTFTNPLRGDATHSGKWLVRMRMESADLPVFENEYEIHVGSVGVKNGPRLLHYKGWWSHTRYRFADKSDK